MTRTVTYLNTLGNKKRFPAKLFTALEIRNEKVKSQLVSDIREESGESNYDGYCSGNGDEWTILRSKTHNGVNSAELHCFHSNDGNRELKTLGLEGNIPPKKVL